MTYYFADNKPWSNQDKEATQNWRHKTEIQVTLAICYVNGIRFRKFGNREYQNPAI